MKTNIKITISKKLYNLINKNKLIYNLFLELYSHHIIEYQKISFININLLFKESYLYYLININHILYYGKIKANEININIL
jgi:hypothetical protein